MMKILAVRQTYQNWDLKIGTRNRSEFGAYRNNWILNNPVAGTRGLNGSELEHGNCDWVKKCLRPLTFSMNIFGLYYGQSWEYFIRWKSYQQVDLGKICCRVFSDLPRSCVGDNLVERFTYNERIQNRRRAWYEIILQTNHGDLDWPGHCHAYICLLGVSIEEAPFYAGGYVPTERMCEVFENSSWDYDICRLGCDSI